MESNDKIESGQPQITDLYTLGAKLFAIGELIKFRGGEPSEERVNYGLGEILTEYADLLIIKPTN